MIRLHFLAVPIYTIKITSYVLEKTLLAKLFFDTCYNRGMNESSEKINKKENRLCQKK